MDEIVMVLIAGLTVADPKVRARSARTLAAWGSAASEAIPSLKPLCLHANTDVRRCSVWALGAIGVRSEEALSVILQTLRDPSPLVRRQSLWALEEMDMPSATVGPLIQALKDQEADVREEAAFVLGYMGPEVVMSAVTLIECVRDPAPSVRRQSILALELLKSTDAIPTIETALNDTDPSVREAARSALLRL